MMRIRGQVFSPSQVRLFPVSRTVPTRIRPTSIRSLTTESTNESTSVQPPVKTDIKSFFESLNKRQFTNPSNTTGTKKEQFFSTLDPLSDGTLPDDKLRAERTNELIETVPMEYLFRLPFTETSESLERRWLGSEQHTQTYPNPPMLSSEVQQLDKHTVMDYSVIIRHQVARKHAIEQYQRGDRIKLLTTNLGEKDRVLRLYHEETLYLKHLSELYVLTGNEKIKEFVLQTLPVFTDILVFYGLKNAKARRLEEAAKIAQQDLPSLRFANFTKKHSILPN